MDNCFRTSLPEHYGAAKHVIIADTGIGLHQEENNGLAGKDYWYKFKVSLSYLTLNMRCY